MSTQLTKSIDSITSSEEDINVKLEELLKLEKQNRLKEHADQKDSMLILTAIHDLLSSTNNNVKLIETLELLIKKHGQFKQNIYEFVDLIIKSLSDVELLNKLIPILDNKIYLELTYCKLIDKIADIYIKSDELNKAYDTISKLDLENVNTIDLDLKLSILIKQMQLCNKLNKFDDTVIYSKKIIPKQIFKFSHLKEKFERDYYSLLIEVYNDSNDYYKIGSTLNLMIDSDSEFNEKELIDCINFLIFSEYDTHLNISLLNSLQKQNKDLIKLPKLKKLLDAFLSKDLIFADDKTSLTIEGKYSFQKPKYNDHLKVFNLKIIEHNIRVISTYYENIKIDRLVELLNIDAKSMNVESVIMDMINNNQITAKINRPLGIINFIPFANDNKNIITQWTDNLELLLNHIDVIDNLIDKEKIVHGI
jgi:26S proteasome regulatory subunit N5